MEKRYLLKGNQLSYTLPNGTAAQITERLNADGLREWVVIEGGKIDVMVFDSEDRQIYVNGSPAEVVSREVLVMSQSAIGGATTLSNDGWYYYGGGDIEVRLETLVKEASASTLYTLMLAAISNPLTVKIGLALVIINFAIAAFSLSKAVYVMRHLYRDINYLAWKAVDNYYLDRYYTEYVTSNTTYYYT